MSLKYCAIKIIFALILWGAEASWAKVLELGESQVQGKKDQPEAMTFVSRAPLAFDGQAIKFEGKDMIKKEVETTKLFDLVYEE